MTTCVRHLVVQSRQYGLMTVYPLDAYRRFSVVWFYGRRLHTVSMNRATLEALLKRTEDNGGSVRTEFDWDHNPGDLSDC